MSIIDPGFATFLLCFVQRCFYKCQDLYCNALRCITKEYCHKQGVSNLYFWCFFYYTSHEANSESLPKVPSTRIFLQLEKTRFSKYMEWWLALQCFWLISLVIFVNTGDFFRPAPSRFPPLLSMFHWTLDSIRFSLIRSNNFKRWLKQYPGTGSE